MRRHGASLMHKSSMSSDLYPRCKPQVFTRGPAALASLKCAKQGLEDGRRAAQHRQWAPVCPLAHLVIHHFLFDLAVVVNPCHWHAAQAIKSHLHCWLHSQPAARVQAWSGGRVDPPHPLLPQAAAGATVCRTKAGCCTLAAKVRTARAGVLTFMSFSRSCMACAARRISRRSVPGLSCASRLSSWILISARPTRNKILGPSFRRASHTLAVVCKAPLLRLSARPQMQHAHSNSSASVMSAFQQLSAETATCTWKPTSAGREVLKRHRNQSVAMMDMSQLSAWRCL